VHYAQDASENARLIPAPSEAERADFYRWAVFLVAAIYPTFTYGDDPKKWVDDEAGAELLKQSTNQHREALWLQMENAAQSPWFLGDRLSAIDLYLTVMTHWRPRSAWFDAHAPKIAAIARRGHALPELQSILERHFTPNQ